MPHVSWKLHFGRIERIIIWKCKSGCKYTSFIWSSRWSPNLMWVEFDLWVDKTYMIRASHSKKLSSSIGPAVIPSGGFTVSSKCRVSLFHSIISTIGTYLYILALNVWTRQRPFHYVKAKCHKRRTCWIYCDLWCTGCCSFFNNSSLSCHNHNNDVSRVSRTAIISVIMGYN